MSADKRRADQERANRAQHDPATRAYYRHRNLDLEMSVLGGVFLNPEMITLLSDTTVEDFTHPGHQSIFMAMRTLEAQNVRIDILTVEVELQRLGRLETVGGLAYLAQLTLRVPSEENAQHYANILRQHRITRDVVKVLSESISILANYEEDVAGEDAIHLATDRLQRIEAGTVERGKTMGAVIDTEYARLIQDLADREAGKDIRPGMPTSIAPLDARIGGIPYSVLSVTGARPSGGKTTFGMALINSAISVGNDEPLFISFEDGESSFAARRFAQASGVPTERFITRNLSGDDMRAIGDAHKTLRDSPDVLVKAAGMTVEDVTRYVRAFRRRRSGKVGVSRSRGRLVVIDYIQKMKLNPELAYKRHEAIGHITRTLSYLAQEEEIAVMLLSQLGRDVDKRPDPTPLMSDFKDSGDIEQDAKLMLGLIWWHGYDRDRDPHLLEAHVLKNYNGESGGLVSRHWDRPTHTISNSAIEVAPTRSRASFKRAAGEIPPDRFDEVPPPEYR